MTMRVEVHTCAERGARVHKIDKEGNRKETAILKPTAKGHEGQWPGVFYLWGDDQLLIEEFDNIT